MSPEALVMPFHRSIYYLGTYSIYSAMKLPIVMCGSYRLRIKRNSVGDFLSFKFQSLQSSWCCLPSSDPWFLSCLWNLMPSMWTGYSLIFPDCVTGHLQASLCVGIIRLILPLWSRQGNLIVICEGYAMYVKDRRLCNKRTGCVRKHSSASGDCNSENFLGVLVLILCLSEYTMVSSFKHMYIVVWITYQHYAGFNHLQFRN